MDYLLDLITTSLEDGEDATTALALGGTLGAICRAGIRVKNLKQILKCLKGDESGDRSVKKGSKAQCRLSMLRALEVNILGAINMLANSSAIIMITILMFVPSPYSGDGATTYRDPTVVFF